MYKRSIRPAVILSGLLLGMGVGVSAASAQTATSDLGVSATVTNNCTISTAALNFGNYNPLSATATTGTGTVTITCTNGATTPVVTLGQGANAAGASTAAVPARRMLNGTANYLNYDLYQNAGNTTVWGDTAGTGIARNGTGVADPLTVYGRIPAGQNTLPAGAYADTVVATVTF